MRTNIPRVEDGENIIKTLLVFKALTFFVHPSERPPENHYFMVRIFLPSTYDQGAVRYMARCPAVSDLKLDAWLWAMSSSLCQGLLLLSWWRHGLTALWTWWTSTNSAARKRSLTWSTFQPSGPSSEYSIWSVFGPILDDRLKEKILKPWKGVLCIHFRVCLRATEHTLLTMNLIFKLSDP